MVQLQVQEAKKLPLMIQVGDIDLTSSIVDFENQWMHMSSEDFKLADFNEDKEISAFHYIWISNDIIDIDLADVIATLPAYKIIYTGKPTSKAQVVLDKRRAFDFSDSSEASQVINRIHNDLYFSQFGFKARFDEDGFLIDKNLQAKVQRNGRFSTVITGDFGDQFVQVGVQRRYFGDIAANSSYIWMEYESQGDIEVRLDIDFYNNQNATGIVKTISIPQSNLRKLNEFTPFGISYSDYQLTYYLKGKGSFEFKNIHIRRSRHGLGMLLAGGEWTNVDGVNEMLSYFNPGVKKGPLVVSFAGSRLYTDKYELMSTYESMGVPHLLFTDARTQGGAFTIGTPEYEDAVTNRIKQALDELEIDGSQLIMVGYSLGSYPALFYTGKLAELGLQPAVVFAAKPIIQLGTFTADKNVGAAIQWNYDIRRLFTGRMDASDTQRLNNRLWETLEKADWSKTETYLFTMDRDEYDGVSLPILQEFFKKHNAKVIWEEEKGFHIEKISEMFKFIMDNLKRIVEEKQQDLIK
ncbi:MAG: accessory Sec system protein Asp2 [Lactobacillaceae bacterium]|jgi:accessory secretory protein Asp2|nr:accessory Sec system protein Asp2 [Lactobacillaceae bacterium]